MSPCSIIPELNHLKSVRRCISTVIVHFRDGAEVTKVQRRSTGSTLADRMRKGGAWRGRELTRASQSACAPAGMAGEDWRTGGAAESFESGFARELERPPPLPTGGCELQVSSLGGDHGAACEVSSSWHPARMGRKGRRTL